MMLQRTSLAIALALATTLALSACSNNDTASGSAPMPATSAPASPPVATPPAAPESPVPVSVASVDLGTAVGANQEVTSPTTTFTPQDTIYASVSTLGSGNATLEAKWTYQDGQSVKDDTKSIAPTGPATTAFSISKPDGWPVGDYHVKISLDGKQVASKDFSVK
ncbi:MAG TPA: hypothetical protein VFP92_01430 [Rhodanobacteraceae bacterium]|nr:hypothetical protein [Rhodanobacteraceae bacterium]